MSTKKVFSGLLGGGITAVIASLGGVKLSNDIDYKKKVNRYQLANKQFKEKAPPEIFDTHYLPSWEDDNDWTTHYKNSITRNSTSSSRLEEFKKKYPNMDAFRSYCYGHAENPKSYAHCNTQDGWCDECVRFKKN